ncbi:MAG TPA: glycosyltransferase family 39 protein [Bacteroidales bacterium]|nr:glycosyltransferase family 39 protein [Bacteroidales bacterium]
MNSTNNSPGLKAGEPRSGNYKKTFLLFLLIWLIVNLIQAVFTEVLSDEAYYGLFGKYLDWGYYDHPPMVALMTRISSLFFSGNLGIRFMTIILQLGTIILIWKTAGFNKPGRTNVETFFIIAGSISLFSVYGVLTSPDSPLLFFTALFFLAYRNFLKQQNLRSVLLLAISMAGLVYSKYQAVLVVGFVILSNFKLLKMPRFWLSGIIALVILAPHIYWQIDNGFPSFQYHLVARSKGFRWQFFLEYLPYQLAVFNPFTLGAVIYVMIKYRPENPLEKSWYFQIAGFIGFFWIMSFRGHVEPHWTIACSIPVILILSEKCRTDASVLRYTRRFILPSIALLLAIRIIMMTDIRLVRNLAFGGKEKKYKEIEALAKDLPVVFTGAFQRPSLYTFFTGKEAMPISTLYSRQTQFDIWQPEKKYHNKPAFICLNQLRNSQIYVSDTIGFGGFVTDSLQTVNRMKIEYDLQQVDFSPGDNLTIQFSLHNPYEFDIDFNHVRFPVELSIVFIKRREITIVQAFPVRPVNIIAAGETIDSEVSIKIPALQDGKYNFGLSLSNMFGPSMNSRFTKINIRKND